MGNPVLDSSGNSIETDTGYVSLADHYSEVDGLKRAIENKLVEIKIHNIRDYSKDPHKKVDDYPFGGGKGMVLKIEPIYDALEDLKTKDSKIIMMTPQGIKYNQKIAYDLSKEKHIII